MRILRYLFGLLLLLTLGNAWALVPVPELKQRVTDLTGTLDSAQNAALTQKLADFEKQNGTQLAVLLLPTTQPETIEQYSIRVVDQWKLGQKGVDNGVLLLVAKQDRKLRIEVGRGLEGTLTDVASKRIIADIITPYFKQGDFVGGLHAGVDNIITTLQGGSAVAPAAPPVTTVQTMTERDNGMDAGDWLPIVVAGLFVIFMLLIAVFGRGKGGRGSGYDSGSSGSSFDSSSDSFSGGGGDFSGGGSSGDW